MVIVPHICRYIEIIEKGYHIIIFYINDSISKKDNQLGFFDIM